MSQPQPHPERPAGPADRARPTQAVILAGGRGTRLGDLTNTRPKPMVECHGKPFLEYIVCLLRDEGFDRVLMLLGYLPDVIQQHFGDGSRWGVRIDYSITSPDDLTWQRLHAAIDLIDPYFLLLYCDNYWPMRFEPMWTQFVAAGLPAMVTVYRNTDNYSRDNVRVAADGRVAAFDRTRTMTGLRGVEIGYAVVDKAVLNLHPADSPAMFEDAVYPTLSARGELLAYLTDHRYYSVGSLERLPVTEKFFSNPATVFLDRDGVINRRPARGEYVRHPGEFEWLPGSLAALKTLADAGHHIVIVTNQAGVAREVMTGEELSALHHWMETEILRAGGRIDGIYCCTHAWDDGCSCRKPNPGLLFQAQHDFNVDLRRAVFIGDDDRDRGAAEAAGTAFELVTVDRSLADIVAALPAGASLVTA